MSQLGKILLIVAFVGGLASAIGGYMIYQKRVEDKAHLDQMTAAKAASDAAAAKSKAEAAAEKQAADKANDDLTAANGKLTDLGTQLSTAQTALTTAQAATQTANDAAKAAQDKLDAFNKTLNGKTPDELVTEKAKADSDLQAAQAEQKLIQDQLDTDTQSIADLHDAINRSNMHPAKMPGVSGKITFVDNAWNFVILDVGLNSGVVPNGELIVYRGRNFLGKVRVTKVDSADSVAEILPDIKGNIQIGDAVLN